ncbi:MULTISPECIES: glycosyltransferase [unclassified Rhodococcus (in: high G+C Gram-positive bacteria)]|uniref:glycosyltransferase n=1 Tax=unclassified Rhodococcus (in: high G+C Gram-positive bacteria) TaxID=192944 RepID=UPI0002F5955D|nr:glycosyltransferase [Rhodococcus sp. DK17]
MARILFVTWDGGGNVPPALGIATEARNRGHQVRFLGHAQQRRRIERHGFRFTPYAHARPWQSTTNHPGITGLYQSLAVFTDAGPGIDLLDTVAREPIDVVVVDCLLYGALQAAADAQLTRVTLVHTYYEFMYQGVTRGVTPVMARLKGQRPLRLWTSSDLALVTTDKDLDPASHRSLPASVHYTGVVRHPMPSPLTPVSERDPLILVSLSSLNFDGQQRALQNILEAVGGLPAHTVVTTGPSVDPTGFTAGPNTEVHGYVPHEQILPTATLVIGHGGHDTTMRALAHDLPLVILPIHPALDQKMIGRSLEQRGVARCLRKTAAPERIRSAVGELLVAGPHRTTAATLGARIRAHDGAVHAADLIDQLPIRERRRGVR